MRHEEGPASGRKQSRNRGFDARAVSVRLDHGCRFGAPGAFAQETPVRGDRGEVDR
jgi:hypothetical protein